MAEELLSVLSMTVKGLSRGPLSLIRLLHCVAQTFKHRKTDRGGHKILAYPMPCNQGTHSIEINPDSHMWLCSRVNATFSG